MTVENYPQGTFQDFVNEKNEIEAAVRGLRRQQSGEGRIESARIESTIIQLSGRLDKVNTNIELLKL